MTVIGILIIAMFTYITNQKLKHKETTIDDRNDSLIYLSIIAISIIFDIVAMYIFIPLIFYGILSVGICVFVIYSNNKREQTIKEKQKTIRQVYQCINKKELPDDVDLDSLDYKISYGKDKKVDTVEFQISANANDNDITRIVYNFNKFFPHRKWKSEVDYVAGECTLIGGNLPPKMAKYPGSWLRPWNFIPFGVNGDAELGWNLDVDEKHAGESQFFYDVDGVKIKANSQYGMVTAHALVLGTTGGGKAICNKNKILIE